MNVEIGTEAAQLPEKEYINGIFLAVYCSGDAIHFTYTVFLVFYDGSPSREWYHRIAVG
jgi:hypothetical protein